MKGFKQNFEHFLKDKKEDKEFRDKRYALNEVTQEDILEIQEEKQQLVEQMHELLKKVDAHEEISFSEHARTIINKNNQLHIIQKGGVEVPVSTGDILVAGMNGFDIKLSKDVNRLTKKRFILQETTRRIKELYNKQLIKAETENMNTHPRDLAIEAYKAIAEGREQKAYESLQHGILAEQMVESFMTKTIADNPELPFTIEMADVYDDVRRKMDFKIHIKKSFERGVGIDAGIQFTLNHEKTDFKNKQIEKSKKFMEQLDDKPVDDLVLVTVSIDEIEAALDSWKSAGKKRSIGGPADNWSKKTQKLIFTSMLEKLPDSLQINPEELWESIQ